MAVPGIAGHVAAFPDSVFGLTSGFFYLPAAQARGWGAHDDTVITEFQCVLALGHFHFAFHDLVADEREAPTAMCLLSDACLLSYLDGLGALVPARSHDYRRLHDRYYNAYAAAVVCDLSHRERLAPYHAGEILGLGDKAAPGATALHVAADLAGRPHVAEPSARALLRLCTGLQLLDDLNDCVDDAVAGNNTWPVTAALLAYPGLDVHDAAAVEAAALGSGVAQACVRLAADAFEDARGQAGRAGADVVAELAGVWLNRSRQRGAALALVG